MKACRHPTYMFVSLSPASLFRDWKYKHVGEATSQIYNQHRKDLEKWNS
jgi:hypothetical protein